MIFIVVCFNGEMQDLVLYIFISRDMGFYKVHNSWEINNTIFFNKECN